MPKLTADTSEMVAAGFVVPTEEHVAGSGDGTSDGTGETEA